jgi:uncharacterized protein (DUF2062 family)
VSIEAPEGKQPREKRKHPWWRAQFARLHKINDTPRSVALGSAVGMFFGFTPLFGLKTLLSILIAWVFRSNKMAAAITVTLHDLILPFVPVIFYFEYQVGMWVLHGRFPHRPHFRHTALRDYMEWTTFFTLGQPTLIGSLFLALPSAVVTYFLVRTFVARAHLVREPV